MNQNKATPSQQADLLLLRDLFDQLTELSKEDRQQELGELAQLHPELAGQLRRLLEAHQANEHFLETSVRATYPQLLGELDDHQARLRREVAEVEAQIRLEESISGQRRLGNFRLDRLLHAGTEGPLYQAFDTHLNRAVAIRVLPSSRIEQPEQRERIVSAASLAARVRHPNVAMILGVHEFGSLLGIVREWIPGLDLECWSRRGSGPLLDQAATILCAALRGLDAMHGCGIVHGDIKPANIVVPSGALSAVLVDFGLARHYGRQAIPALSPPPEPAPTENGEENLARPEIGGPWGGTPHFLAPEIILGRPAAPCSDLFSMGVVLYWLCTGKHPFDGSTVGQVLQNILQCAPPPMTLLQPNLPQPLEALVEQLLQRDPERRPPSARDVEERLSTWAQKSRQDRTIHYVPIALPLRGKRRTWLREAGLWGATFAVGAAVSVGGRSWARHLAEPNPPPFLKWVPDECFDRGASETSTNIADFLRVRFGRFESPEGVEVDLAYPQVAGQWASLVFEQIECQRDSDHAFVDVRCFASRSKEYSRQVELSYRIIGEQGDWKALITSTPQGLPSITREGTRITDLWRPERKLQFRVRLKYLGPQQQPQELPCLGLETIYDELRNSLVSLHVRSWTPRDV